MRKSMSVIVTAGLLAASFVSAPVAVSAKHICNITALWTSPITGDTWKFTRCRDTMDVVRSGGKLGRCENTYPVGRWYEVPEDDCAYFVSGGPI